MDACAAADGMARGMIGVGIATFLFLSTGFRAPYGRHKAKQYRWEVPGRVAWLTQEMWSCLIPVTLFLHNNGKAQTVPLLLLAAHYIYRSFVYPFWLQQPKPTPLHVWLAACAFVVYNSVLQGLQLVYCRHSHVAAAQTAFGAILWGIGLSIDIQSDLTLQNLRRQNPQKGYQIPYSGLYELVSCPNYLGETVEWIGYAIATDSLAGSAFAFYTFANLAPRAQHHHQWYREQFTDYPNSRKAYIPYLW